MKFVLIVSGILAAIALLSPTLVTYSYFLFIIPGVIMTLAPTVFVYLALATTLRSVLPLAPGFSTNVIAFGAALLVGWLVMQPFRVQALANFKATLQPDIVPSEPISLSGNVRVELDDQYLRKRTKQCDYFCAALLDMPYVTSVTVVQKDECVTFALVQAEEHPQPSLFPNDPGQIVFKTASRDSYNQRKAAARLVEAKWALRLASDERLVVREPPAEQADWVVRRIATYERGKSELRRVEIVDSRGDVRFRKSYVKHLIPERLFHFGFEGRLSGSSRFCLGRQKLESGEGAIRSDLESTLVAGIALTSPRVQHELLDELRAEVASALDDPAASPARLSLACRWLSLFFYDAAERDYALIGRVVADPRIEGVVESLASVFRTGDVPAQLNVAYAQRILMEHSTAKERRAIANELAQMPTRTFAEPDAAHLAIWNSPELRSDAAPFVERVADLGSEKALAILLETLDAALLTKRWHERRHVIEGIKAGFIRLGPDASAAAPRIQSLFLQRPSPIMNAAREADDWRFALARMGVAIDDLPFFPSASEKSIERTKSKVRARLQRYLDDQAKLAAAK